MTFAGVRGITHRIVRNPRKYAEKRFWRSVTVPAQARAAMEVLYAPAFVRSAVRHGVRRVAFFPSALGAFMPEELYLAWKVLRMCGALACTGSYERPQLAIAWHPSTQYELDAGLLARMHARCRVLNSACSDIRKSVVDRVFGEIFGYAITVDPCTHSGPVLRKSERNGAHDAAILQGPLRFAEPGYVYQRLISHEMANGMAEWRVTVVDGNVAATYINYRPAASRFQPLPSACEYCEAADAFSAAERERIGAFATQMGLDFGVLDVLRDTSGRIYICDCNNSPTGPAPRLPTSKQLAISSQVAEAFERAYFFSR